MKETTQVRLGKRSRGLLICTMCAYLLVGIGVGWTGSIIPWSSFLTVDWSLATLESQTLLHDPHYEAGFIRTAAADPRSNCHGWTFAGGDRKLHSQEVESLLRECGYQETKRPDLGDVVIYRDDSGVIIHSGVVRARGSQALIIIESKWGPFGRFLHQLELRPCSCASLGFYKRPNDHPRIAETEALDSAAE